MLIMYYRLDGSSTGDFRFPSALPSSHILVTDVLSEEEDAREGGTFLLSRRYTDAWHGKGRCAQNIRPRHAEIHFQVQPKGAIRLQGLKNHNDRMFVLGVLIVLRKGVVFACHPVWLMLLMMANGCKQDRNAPRLWTRHTRT